MERRRSGYKVRAGFRKRTHSVGAAAAATTHAAGRLLRQQPPVRSRPAVRRVAYIAIRTRLGRRLTSSSGEEALFETRPMSGSRANYVSRPKSRHRAAGEAAVFARAVLVPSKHVPRSKTCCRD
ncbi:hypothetical protein MRX96_008265 [Rhipicephalus microplus]